MLYPGFSDLSKVRNSLLASENIKRFRATIAQNSQLSVIFEERLEIYTVLWTFPSLTPA